MQHTNADPTMSYRYTPSILLCVCLLPSRRAAELTSTMTRILDVLTKTLESLDENDFDRFRFNLWNRGQIPRQRLEKANVDDIVAMMVQAYCESNCGRVVSDILRKMNFNQLAFNLDKELQSGK